MLHTRHIMVLPGVRPPLDRTPAAVNNRGSPQRAPSGGLMGASMDTSAAGFADTRAGMRYRRVA